MGFGEIILILAVALILFGPEDLPKVARVIGKMIYEIRKVTHDLTKEFQNFIETPEPEKPGKRSGDFTESEHSSFRNSPTSGNFQQESGVSRSEAEASDPPLGNSILQPEIGITKPENADPLAELPKDMVSYEEKGASR